MRTLILPLYAFMLALCRHYVDIMLASYWHYVAGHLASNILPEIVKTLRVKAGCSRLTIHKVPIGTKGYSTMERNEQIQQLAILAGQGNSTAGSLLNALLKGKASPKQQAYIESLCGGSSATTLDTSAILQAFASSPSRSPKAVLTTGTATVCAKYVRPDSTSHLLKEENRGSITLSFGQFRTPEAKYYGRILANGQFLKGADCTDEILLALESWSPAVY